MGFQKTEFKFKTSFSPPPPIRDIVLKFSRFLFKFVCYSHIEEK